MSHKELSQRMDAFEQVCTRPGDWQVADEIKIKAADVSFRINQKYVSCDLTALESSKPYVEDYFFMSKMNAF